MSEAEDDSFDLENFDLDEISEEELEAAIEKFLSTVSYTEKVDWKEFPELDEDPED